VTKREKEAAQWGVMEKVLDLLYAAQKEWGPWPTAWPFHFGESGAWTAGKIAKSAAHGLPMRKAKGLKGGRDGG